MKTIFISILAVFASISLYAQNNVNSVLTTIEENNTTLKALRETAEAQKLGEQNGYLPCQSRSRLQLPMGQTRRHRQPYRYQCEAGVRYSHDYRNEKQSSQRTK